MNPVPALAFGLIHGFIRSCLKRVIGIVFWIPFGKSDTGGGFDRLFHAIDVDADFINYEPKPVR